MVGLAESGLLALAEGETNFTQEIGDRLLPVGIEYRDQRLQSVIMTQEPPVFGKTCEDLSALAVALALNEVHFRAASRAGCFHRCFSSAGAR